MIVSNIKSLTDRDIAKEFIHYQNSPISEWNINHEMNCHPSIIVIDSSGNEVIGDVQYIDGNNVKIKFSGAFSGKAVMR